MTPIYDATLSDLLLRARQQVEEAELGRRQDRVRHAFALQELESRVRAEVVAAALSAPVPVAEIPSAPEPAVDPEEPTQPAPPVPSLSELMAPSRSNDAFFDALLGPAR